jgi:hypothetical protein
VNRFFILAAALVLTHCGSNKAAPGSNEDGGGRSESGLPETTSAEGGADMVDGSTVDDGPPDSTDSPKVGQPGCGFATAAFCDTFDSPSTRQGRGGELDVVLWSAGRMDDALSTTRAMGIGMAVIPQCRPGVPTHVWPDGDTLICDPTPDIASNHLLVGAAAQYYGQNGYRIRQPFDFANRTGKIVFDATVNLLSPLHGWVSLAITEDPISMPGYSVQSNDEGSIIPRNAVEVHFANFGDQTKISVRDVHVFREYVDTVYEPLRPADAPSYQPGKLNHFEFLVSEQGIEVTITPYSEDGVHFAAPAFDYKLNAPVPFSRGYVHVSVHNHAMLKYTQPDSHLPNIVDATVAQIDNVGFDGPVIGGWREYEVPDSLVKFMEKGFQPLPDPYNPDDTGYDIGYVVDDAATGPKQVLHFAGVDTSNVVGARIAFSAWMDFLTRAGPPDQFTFMARLNGKGWLSHKLSVNEAAFFTSGPTTIEPDGGPAGQPGTQGRLALLIDVPKEDLFDGDNTIEFVSANIPRSYPPLVCNIDLVLKTN